MPMPTSVVLSGFNREHSVHHNCPCQGSPTLRLLPCSSCLPADAQPRLVLEGSCRSYSVHRQFPLLSTVCAAAEPVTCHSLAVMMLPRGYREFAVTSWPCCGAAGTQLHHNSNHNCLQQHPSAQWQQRTWPQSCPATAQEVHW